MAATPRLPRLAEEFICWLGFDLWLIPIRLELPIFLNDKNEFVRKINLNNHFNNILISIVHLRHVLLSLRRLTLRTRIVRQPARARFRARYIALKLI